MIWKGFEIGFQGFGKESQFGKNWGGISKIWKGFSIWKGFGMGFQGFGKDSRLGKDLGYDFNDLEAIFDLEKIWDGISKILKGFSIWK